MCVRAHEFGCVSRQVSAAAVRSCDLRLAFACCENIIASVYYYSTERQWECCVPCGPAKSGCRPGVCERKEFFLTLIPCVPTDRPPARHGALWVVEKPIGVD